MLNVRISRGDSRLFVRAYRDVVFEEAAPMLGGRFDADVWSFDLRDEQRVRALCLRCYGTDGLGPVKLVTLRVQLRGGDYRGRRPITLGGRLIAEAIGKDSGARLGDGVIVLEGGFISTGSQKNWATEVKSSGATILLRDLPAPLAEQLLTDGAREDELQPSMMAIEDESLVINRVALLSEREQLQARIDEIDELLNSEGEG